MRLIDADALIDSIDNGTAVTSSGSYNRIDKMARAILGAELMIAPTVEAVPVKHGHFVAPLIKDSILCGCSVCGFTLLSQSFNYCPNCGARMDGGADVQN